jgi:signal transduction histidine kinase
MIQDTAAPDHTLTQLMLEAANEGSWFWDLNSDEIIWNERHFELLGLYGKTSTLKFENILERIHPEDRNDFLEHLKSAKESGQRFELGYRVQNPLTDEYRFCLLRGRYLYDASGHPIQMIALLKDDTSRWAMQEALKKNLEIEAFHRGFVELVSKTLDFKNILKISGERLCQFFAADRCVVICYNNVCGQKEVKILESYEADPTLKAINNIDLPIRFLPEIKCLNPKVHSRIDKATYPIPEMTPALSNYFKNSKLILNAPMLRFPELVEICPICAHNLLNTLTELQNKYALRSEMSREIVYQNKVYGRVSLFQCHNDRVWTEAEATILDSIIPEIGVAFYQAELFQEEQAAKQVAELANKNKDLFLTNVSHELKTPLTAILGFSQMLEQCEERDNFSDRVRRYLENIQTSAHQLVDIVDAILDLSMISSNELSISMEWFEIKPLAESVIQNFYPLANSKNVNLNLYVQVDLFVIKADPLRIKQILSNLIDNAIKFNPIGGQVTVSVYKSEPDWVAFSVQDTGIGISKDQISGLFQAFSQADQGLSRRYSGIGIGLALTKYLIELQNGVISVESEPGKGSNFIFKLPLVEIG